MTWSICQERSSWIQTDSALHRLISALSIPPSPQEAPSYHYLRVVKTGLFYPMSVSNLLVVSPQPTYYHYHSLHHAIRILEIHYRRHRHLRLSRIHHSTRHDRWLSARCPRKCPNVCSHRLTENYRPRSWLVLYVSAQRLRKKDCPSEGSHPRLDFVFWLELTVVFGKWISWI